MKKTLRIISLFLASVMIILVLASCNEKEITDQYLNEEGHVIIQYDDGTTKDLGELKGLKEETGISGVSLDENLHFIVTYSDGTTKDFGKAEGMKDPVSVETITVNDEKHAIVSLNDGTELDLGYVGVEVEVPVEVVPPKYTVRFVDLNGKTLSTQKVYRGDAAEAPKAPAEADMTFDKWDTDYTNIQSDVTIKPIYIGAARYTVQFLDDKGNVLSTQTVISGHDATPPKVPAYEDTIFDKWDRGYTNVKSDLTVKAVYRAKKTFTVTFLDYSGVTLGSASVKEGGTAKAPVTPTREGYKFTGWSSDLSGITSNKTLTAKYSFSGGTNVMDLSSSVSGSTLTVTFKVSGSVKFCGMEGNVKIPSGLTCSKITEGDGATANVSDGMIYFMFASNSGKNVTSATTIMTVTFKIGNGVTNAELKTAITDMYDQDYKDVSFSVIGTKVKLG